MNTAKFYDALGKFVALNASKLSVAEYSQALQPGGYTDDEKRLYGEVYAQVLADTQDALAASQAAGGAVTRARLGMRVKSALNSGNAVVAGWGALFTNSERPDTYGEYFHYDTEFYLAYYAQAPLWYEHRQRALYGVDPIGQRCSVQRFERGLYVTHELFKDHPRFEDTLREVNAGLLSYSLDGYGDIINAKIGDDGALNAFPALGWSLVRFPAEPALGRVAVIT